MTDSRQSNLRNTIRQHYEQQQASPESLQHWLTMQQPTIQRPKKSRAVQLAISAAAIALCLSIWQFGSNPFYTTVTNGSQPYHAEQPGMSDTIYKIADEVAKNHLKMRPLEIKTDDFQQLRAYFTELDFSPIRSSRFHLDAQQMLGARYCSIQSVTAAQLRYRKSEGISVSLYESEYLEGVFGPLPHLDRGESPLTLQRKGLHIRIWVEQKLLMVSVSEQPLAGSQSSTP